jgi:hypothetical protein
VLDGGILVGLVRQIQYSRATGEAILRPPSGVPRARPKAAPNPGGASHTAIGTQIPQQFSSGDARSERDERLRQADELLLSRRHARPFRSARRLSKRIAQRTALSTAAVAALPQKMAVTRETALTAARTAATSPEVSNQW